MPSLQTLLTLPELKGAHVIAGSESLRREVACVRLGFSSAQLSVVLPGELILVHPGIGWCDEVPETLSLFTVQGGAGLLVQAGAVEEASGRALVRHAERWKVPIIHLHRRMPRRELVGAVMRHLSPAPERDSSLSMVTEMMLMGGDLSVILRRVSELTGGPACYFASNLATVVCYPSESERLEAVREYLASRITCCSAPGASGRPAEQPGLFGYLVTCTAATFSEGLNPGNVTVLALPALDSGVLEAIERACRDQFLAQLTRGLIPLDEAPARARRLGLSLAQRYIVLFLAPVGEPRAGGRSQRTLAQAVGEAVSSLGIRCLRTTVETGLVVLLPGNGNNDAVDQEAARLHGVVQGLMGDVEICQGVSDNVELSSLPRGLDQARSAFQLSRRVWGGGSYSYSKLGAYHFLDEVGSGPQAATFLMTTLGGLLQSDEEEPMQLLETLRVYFEVHRSRVECARRLFVHPNTVGHRLHKVESATGLSLARADHSFDMQLALRLAELLFSHRAQGTTDRRRVQAGRTGQIREAVRLLQAESR